MYSGRSTRALPRVSFLIRRFRDQRLVSTSPGLIAAAHVLHRLLAPRHPPCALSLLIQLKNKISTTGATMEFSRCAQGVPRSREQPASEGRSLKTQQRGYDEVDVLLGELIDRTARRPYTGECLPEPSSDIPRKEVIQPQLPLRLPCYDFTPIINPTFDGCLPCGLAHRLRVLPTFVV